MTRVPRKDIQADDAERARGDFSSEEREVLCMQMVFTACVKTLEST